MAVLKAFLGLSLFLVSIGLLLFPVLRPSDVLPSVPYLGPVAVVQIGRGEESPVLKLPEIAANGTFIPFMSQTFRTLVENKRFISLETEAELVRLRASKNALEASKKMVNVVRLVEDDMKKFGGQVYDAQRDLNQSYEQTKYELIGFKEGIRSALDAKNTFLDRFCTVIGTLIGILAFGLAVLTYFEKKREGKSGHAPSILRAT